MKVKEAIEFLSKMPPNAEFFKIYDGAVREDIDCIYLNKRGEVCAGSKGEVIYDTEDRPVDAPNELQEKYYYL